MIHSISKPIIIKLMRLELCFILKVNPYSQISVEPQYSYKLYSYKKDCKIKIILSCILSRAYFRVVLVTLCDLEILSVVLEI